MFVSEAMGHGEREHLVLNLRAAQRHRADDPELHEFFGVLAECVEQRQDVGRSHFDRLSLRAIKHVLAWASRSANNLAYYAPAARDWLLNLAILASEARDEYGKVPDAFKHAMEWSSDDGQSGALLADYVAESGGKA